MPSSLCNEFVSEVSSAFAYLLCEHGFKIRHSEEARVGQACLVILENAIRMKFVFDRGGVEILVGSRMAPISWTDEEDGKRRWFQLLGAISLARGDPKPTTETIMELGRRVMALGPSGYMRYAAEELRPVLGRVESLLSGEEVELREKELEEYFYA